MPDAEPVKLAERFEKAAVWVYDDRLRGLVFVDR
jgi:hypothetical protein